MTSVIMIAPLNAANFESGDANEDDILIADGNGGAAWSQPFAVLGAGGAIDGEVLTADGTGWASWRAPAGGVLPTIPNGQLVVSGAGTNGANRSFALMQELVNGYPAWDGGGYRVTRETYPDMRWCIYWPGDELPMYGSNDPVETPDLVTDWAAVLGGNPPPSSVVILPAPAPANTIPVSDGTGDVTWQNQPIGVPSVVGASEGDTLTINNGAASWQAPAGGAPIPNFGEVFVENDPTPADTCDAAYLAATGTTAFAGAMAYGTYNGDNCIFLRTDNSAWMYFQPYGSLT